MPVSDINKQDQVLTAIGLKRLMIWEAPLFSVYDPSKFKNYVTRKYLESQTKETDEVYSMFEMNLLHVESGLRLTLITSENDDGTIVEYSVIRLFILSSKNEELEVLDANFERKLFSTPGLDVPFAETNKLIE